MSNGVLSLSEAKARLGEFVADCDKDEEELLITRNGRPAAVLMGADEYEGWRERMFSASLCDRADALNDPLSDRDDAGRG